MENRDPLGLKPRRERSEQLLREPKGTTHKADHPIQRIAEDVACSQYKSLVQEINQKRSVNQRKTDQYQKLL